MQDSSISYCSSNATSGKQEGYIVLDEPLGLNCGLRTVKVISDRPLNNMTSKAKNKNPCTPAQTVTFSKCLAVDEQETHCVLTQMVQYSICSICQI